MENYKVIIADDNADSKEIIAEFIEYLPDFTVVAVASDGKEVIEQVMKHKDVDVVLVDIRMPKLNGVEAIKICKEYVPDLKFIFITGYNDYAVEAFTISALDYIVKPVEAERLYKALDKVRKSSKHTEGISKRIVEDHNKRIIVRNKKLTFYIPIDEILFVEKNGKEAFIHTVEKTYITFETLDSIEKKLTQSFFQSHRSYIINLNKISHIETSGRTYLAYFLRYDKSAYISKHKISTVQQKLII
ncbi:LytR/AlgR family response regulator transcription factor [Halalkalibacter nanhaiisediminis]|uniref:LytTR family two component transcriptional regulator n=1 Tax=Halalkalibacter nanhaiisediminis TaxID=688079 RepID=A0A562QSV1_9BACI|nr:LytTR family DNA-binding domain-containing protein [Halalkalibacter nanhaiisediminis]TWI59166.1 LytTR family two component transcriptional regulator [Halalkalibacter nanhaiisediminis]